MGVSFVEVYTLLGQHATHNTFQICITTRVFPVFTVAISKCLSDSAQVPHPRPSLLCSRLDVCPLECPTVMIFHRLRGFLGCKTFNAKTKSFEQIKKICFLLSFYMNLYYHSRTFSCASCRCKK